MSSPYLNNLITIAQTDLPQLAHDIENASTIYTVQDAAKKMLNILMYVVHHVILGDPSVAAAQAAQAAAARASAAPMLPPPPAGQRYVRGPDGKIYLEQIPVSVPVAVQAAPMMAMPVGHAPAVDHWPSQAHVAQPVAAAPTAFGLPPIGQPAPDPQNRQSQVVEVTITPEGSSVAVPGQPVRVMPPGVPVNAAPAVQSRPIGVSGIPGMGMPMTIPVGTPGQPAEVVVSADSMTAEVAAALAGRKGDQPMIDASGGARNVTNE